MARFFLLEFFTSRRAYSNVKFRSLSAGVAAAILLSTTATVQAQDLGAVGAVPNMEAPESSKSAGGQCYARVSIPAVYKTESVEIEVRPELARFKVTPPVFKDGTETVTVTPAVNKITAIQPVMETKTEEFEVMAGMPRWVRGSTDSNKPLTAGELEALKGAGIDTADVEAGTCFYEHFIDATLEDIPTRITISDASETLSVTDAVLKEELVTVTTVPAHTRMIEVPPSLKKGAENVLIQPATKAWKTECGAVQQVDYMTGETLCLVDVAAEYETVETEVVDIPALITNVDESGETTNVTTQVLVSEAKEVRTAIPAKFDSIDRQRITKPARYNWLAKNAKPAFGAEATGRVACFVNTPAITAEYEREVVKTAGRFETETVPAKTETVNIKQLVAEAVSNQTKQAPKFQNSAA